MRSADPELAWQADQLRGELERRAAAGAVARQHVHEIDVPPMVTAQVVVVAEVAIALADLPVAMRVDAVAQRTIVQHGQIEARAVPRHERRRVALEAVEKPLHELALGRLARRRG